MFRSTDDLDAWPPGSSPSAAGRHPTHSHPGFTHHAHPPATTEAAQASQAAPLTFPKTAPLDSALMQLALNCLVFNNPRAVAVIWQRCVQGRGCAGPPGSWPQQGSCWGVACPLSILCTCSALGANTLVHCCPP